MSGDEAFAQRFAADVARIPGVLAVALGGSRARGESGPLSDWDFALYYRGHFDADDVRAVGWEGDVADVGGWGGGVYNGGAWLQVDGRAVDLHYRDLDDVEYRWREAQAGRFRKEFLMFYAAGVPTYIVVAELAVCRVLVGELPRPEYPDALAGEAAQRWHRDAVLSLGYAHGSLVKRSDPTVALANANRGLIEEAHSRLAARREWVLNEKGMVARAGLGHLAAALLEASTARDLRAAIETVQTEVAAAGSGSY